MDKLRAYCNCAVASFLTTLAQESSASATDDAFSVCARLLARGLMSRVEWRMNGRSSRECGDQTDCALGSSSAQE